MRVTRMSTNPSLNAGLPAVAPIISTLHRESPLNLPQLLHDFLEWAQQKTGFILCEVYKPRYDGYTPIAYHSRSLVEKFKDGGMLAQLVLSHGCLKTLQPALEIVSSP